MLSDTHPAVERKLIELLRAAGPSARLRKAISMTDAAIELSRRAIARANPGAAQRERDLLFVTHCYGKELSERVRKHLESQGRRHAVPVPRGCPCDQGARQARHSLSQTGNMSGLPSSGAVWESCRKMTF